MNLPHNLVRGLLALTAIMFVAGCGGGTTASAPQTNSNIPYKPAPAGRSSMAVVGVPSSSTFDLMAGQNTLAGQVVISNDATSVTVTYSTVGDWRLMATHLYVGLNTTDKVAPGQFPYKHENLGGVTTDTFVVPLPSGAHCGTPIYIATHADMQEYNTTTGFYFNGQTGWGKGNIKFPRNWGSFITYKVTPFCPLPDADFDFTVAYPGPASYFQDTFSGIPAGYVVNDGTLYTGWCVDLFHYITPGAHYTVHLYSSYSTNLPTYLQDSDWDMVNYVINHKQGTPQDVQDAIWYFVGGGGMPGGAAGQAMVADALANGEGFVPGANQVTAVIVYAGASTQITIIEVLCDC